MALFWLRWSRKIKTKVRMVRGVRRAFCHASLVEKRGRDKSHTAMTPSTRRIAGVLPSHRLSAWTTHSIAGGELFGSSGSTLMTHLVLGRLDPKARSRRPPRAAPTAPSFQVDQGQP